MILIYAESVPMKSFIEIKFVDEVQAPNMRQDHWHMNNSAESISGQF